jgi:DnaD/phage-associated family protein
VLGVLLEQIDDLAELKVTLRGFWLANQKKGSLRGISHGEFLNDKVLVEGLQGLHQSPQEAIQRGLDLAVRRRTFLVYQSGSTRPEHRLYAVNTEGERRALARWRAGGKSSPPDRTRDGIPETIPEIIPEVIPEFTPENSFDAPYAESSRAARPNIFALYENNIGTISPLLAEKLGEAEDLYPGTWIDQAFQIAVTRNKRSWAYISAILRRWVDEGKDDGEPGRHSQKDNPTNHLEEYRQLRGHLPWESGSPGEPGSPGELGSQ